MQWKIEVEIMFILEGGKGDGACVGVLRVGSVKVDVEVYKCC